MLNYFEFDKFLPPINGGPLDEAARAQSERQALAPGHGQLLGWTKWDNSSWMVYEGMSLHYSSGHWWGPDWQVIVEIDGPRVIVGSWIWDECFDGYMAAVAGGYKIFNSRLEATPEIIAVMRGR